MLKMARLTPLERAKLGAAGRRKVEREFCQSIVIESYLAAVAAKDRMISAMRQCAAPKRCSLIESYELSASFSAEQRDR